MTQIGDRLSRLLKESGYTQKEFALMCGVTEAAMCRYLKNEREIPRLRLLQTWQQHSILLYYHEGNHYVITGVGTNGFIISAYPKRRKD